MHEPDNHWWEGLGLASPEAVIKVLVMKSQCFTLVDRGKGLEAAEQERALASGGDLRGGSNIGKGQIKAADYVLIPRPGLEEFRRRGHEYRRHPGRLRRRRRRRDPLGHQHLQEDRRRGADHHRCALDRAGGDDEGHSDKTDVGFGVAGGWGGWGGFGGAGVSSYTNSEIGQVVILAYIDAYTKLVDQLGGVSANASADNAAQAVNNDQARHDVQKVGRQGRRGAQAFVRHDALSHRRQGRRVVGSVGRTRQQGLGVVAFVRTGEITLPLRQSERGLRPPFCLACSGST
ncbi:MAG: hypothetical protein WDM81_20295 [Rhizomicrobium sp.]